MLFFQCNECLFTKKTTWPGQCICPPLASTPSLDLETVLAAPGKAIQQNHPSLVKGKNEATENFLEFLSRIHFWPFFIYSKKRLMCFWMAKTWDLSTRTRFLSTCRQSLQAQKEPLPPVDPKVGRNGENDGRYPKPPIIMVQWKMGVSYKHISFLSVRGPFSTEP